MSETRLPADEALGRDELLGLQCRRLSELVAILEALQQAGALHAQLIVI